MCQKKNSLSHIRRFRERLGSNSKYTQNLGYMAYNRKNLLNRVITIQNLVLDGQKKGITQKWIYENEVYPRYFISYSTFNNFLVMPAKKELELLKKREAESKRQLSIEFI